MGEEHFDLLPQPHWDRILFGLRNITGDLAGIFMLFAGDPTHIRFWAEPHLRRAGLTNVFQSLVLGDTFTRGSTVGVGIVAAELLERFTLGVDVLIILRVPLKVGADPCAICSTCFVQHRNVGFDIAIYEPSFILLVFQQDKRNYATQFRMCRWSGVSPIMFILLLLKIFHSPHGFITRTPAALNGKTSRVAMEYPLLIAIAAIIPSALPI